MSTIIVRDFFAVERNLATAQNLKDATLPLCSATLGISKVAILFIARQGMPLEKLWDAWFHGLDGAPCCTNRRQSFVYLESALVEH